MHHQPLATLPQSTARPPTQQALRLPLPTCPRKQGSVSRLTRRVGWWHSLAAQVKHHLPSLPHLAPPRLPPPHPSGPSQVSLHHPPRTLRHLTLTTRPALHLPLPAPPPLVHNSTQPTAQPSTHSRQMDLPPLQTCSLPAHRPYKTSPHLTPPLRKQPPPAWLSPPLPRAT